MFQDKNLQDKIQYHLVLQLQFQFFNHSFKSTSLKGRLQYFINVGMEEMIITNKKFFYLVIIKDIHPNPTI